MLHLDIDIQQLAARSRVSPTTINELVRNTTQRDRHSLTLARLSRALQLDPDHLRHIASTPTEPTVTIVRRTSPRRRQ
ncbi:helix-turn-helix domain-containing protein [Actinokineospora baliensis]|uniref:helix-turn-helix domain-containing protein n=1 Tax=Actinokineospora baliensis TaxID=547056 RepID=UPI003558EA84